MNEPKNAFPGRKPDWLKTRLPQGKEFLAVKEIVEKNKLHTICSSGRCPNMGECWGASTATFMILGNICTRSCKFCNVSTGKPLPPDPDEPARVARSAQLMKLKHVVVTSVDRDDLPDGGASVWVQTIMELKHQLPGATIEALIPDFDGKAHLVSLVASAGAEVVSHNLETVKRLTPVIRSRAKYQTSLHVLKTISDSGVTTKSGIMAGLGETPREVLECLADMKSAGVQVVTIGQYLAPTKNHFPVVEYITPELFEYFKSEALQMGFRRVESGPLVRSSYKAENHI